MNCLWKYSSISSLKIDSVLRSQTNPTGSLPQVTTFEIARLLSLWYCWSLVTLTTHKRLVQNGLYYHLLQNISEVNLARTIRIVVIVIYSTRSHTRRNELRIQVKLNKFTSWIEPYDCDMTRLEINVENHIMNSWEENGRQFQWQNGVFEQPILNNWEFSLHLPEPRRNVISWNSRYSCIEVGFAARDPMKTFIMHVPIVPVRESANILAHDWLLISDDNCEMYLRE